MSGLLVLFLGSCLAPVLLISTDLSVGYFLQNETVTRDKINLIKNLFDSISKPPPKFYAVSDPANAAYFRETLVLPFDYRDHNYDPMPGFPRYDQFKRRLSLSPQNTQQKDHFNIFLGGSFLYGDGVTDEFTLPSQIQSRLTNYQSYNYCIEGGSPAHALTLMSRRQLTSQIQQKSGSVFFEITGSSFGRISGTPANSAWLKYLPYTEVDSNGRLGLKGTLDEARPVHWFLINWFRLSVISNFINLGENDWDKLFPNRTKQLCKIIEETKRVISEQVTVEGFYVLGYGLKKEAYLEMKDCLQGAGIQLHIIRNAEIDVCMSKTRRSHPSELSHAEAANHLIYKLDLWPNAKKSPQPNLNFSCIVGNN